MKIIAEKRTTEHTENNIEVFRSLYEVLPGETVEALMLRVGLSGKC